MRQSLKVDKIAEELNVPDVQYGEVIVYLDDGTRVSEAALDKRQKSSVCARKIKFKHTTEFVVKSDGGHLYNPNQTDVFYRKKPWKFLRVSEQVFNLYTKFLSSKREMYKTQAERNL